jgi:hypothetical protein
MTHHRFALLATTAILVLSVGSAPPRAGAQTIYPDQEIFWDESQGGIYVLPGGANFGASLCAAQSGAGMAQAATTSAHARAQLELVGNEWTVASQSPNSEGPQLFACGHDSDGPGLVTTIKRPPPASQESVRGLHERVARILPSVPFARLSDESASVLAAGGTARRLKSTNFYLRGHTFAVATLGVDGFGCSEVRKSPAIYTAARTGGGLPRT